MIAIDRGVVDGRPAGGVTRRLDGENGWGASDGEALAAAVDRGLHLAIDTLLRDASGALSRPGRPVKVKSAWVWEKEPRTIDANVLEEAGDIVVLTSDASSSAVTIIDRSAIKEMVDRKP